MKHILAIGTALSLTTSVFSHTSFQTEEKLNYPSNYQVDSGVDLFYFWRLSLLDSPRRRPELHSIGSKKWNQLCLSSGI